MRDTAPTRRLRTLTAHGRLAAALTLLLALAWPGGMALGQTGGPSPAPPPDRVALVLGNGAYAEIPALPNAVADARAMAALLQDLGFAVLTAYDADRTGMEQALRRFGEQARGADAALVFYAGHGLQAAGGNYLLPVGATADEPADLRYEAVALALVEAELADSGAAVRMVVLDACRDNPLIDRMARGAGTLGRSTGATRGLAPIQSTTGTLYAYATAPGEIALDGDGPHSPFTAALLDWLPTPGLEVGLLFRRVRAQVIEATDGAQVPWVEEAIVGEFYFVPAETAEDPDLAAGEAADSAEVAYWESVRDSRDPADFRAYLDRYPNGLYATLAGNRLTRLEASAAWPPRLVSDPPHLADGVPVDIGRIRLAFDRPMADAAVSLVPAPDIPFPAADLTAGRWLDDRRYELTIGPLLPRTTYGLRINSPTQHGFRIAETGQPWPETLIRFTTAPSTILPANGEAAGTP